jgi:predicted transcriptional regulator
MDGAYELVAFLTRAENRVTVLHVLERAPATRVGLQDETGIPRATLSRILADFRDRSLVTRDGHRYELTPLGGHLATELSSLFSSVESQIALQTVAEWLPLDELGLAVEDLKEIEVTLPTPIDPMAPVKAAAEAIDNVDHVQAFCYSVLHAPILAECQNVTERGQRFQGVIAEGVLDVVSSDPELAERLIDLLTHGQADLYVFDGVIQQQLVIADRLVMFLVADEEGAIQGLVSIDDESIIPWAEATFESIRRKAEPITADRATELLMA